MVAKGFTFWGQWTTAMSVVIALLFILAYYQTGAVNSQYRVLAALTLLGSVPCYSLLHVYHKKHHHLNGLCRLSLGWLVTLLGLASIGLLSNTSDLFSLEIIIVWSLLGLCVQILLYVPIHYLSGYYHRQLNRQHKTLIIGNNALALKLAGTLSKHEHLTLVGLVKIGRASCRERV